MAYKKDKDLEFLQYCSNDQLSPLVKVLTETESGNSRLTEELTVHEHYKKHHPNHKKYWDLIAAEIQCFGGNTLATMVRGGKGVLYWEVLIDVCKKEKVEIKSDESAHRIEDALLKKLNPHDGPSRAEAEDAMQTLILGTSFYATGGATAAILSTAARISPIGVAGLLAALWLLSGPAYRVTRPAVLAVAVIRRKVISRCLVGLKHSFEDQFWEAERLLVAMGARYLRVESTINLSAKKAGKASSTINLSARKTDKESSESEFLRFEGIGETCKNDRKRFLYEVKYDRRRDHVQFDESMLQKSVWYRDDPFFKKLLDDYRRGELVDSEHTLERDFDQSTLVNGKLEFTLSKVLEIAGCGEIKEHQSQEFSVYVKF